MPKLKPYSHFTKRVKQLLRYSEQKIFSLHCTQMSFNVYSWLTCVRFGIIEDKENNIIYIPYKKWFLTFK